MHKWRKKGYPRADRAHLSHFGGLEPLSEACRGRPPHPPIYPRGAPFSQEQPRARPYLPQPLAQLSGELELLGVAQTLKGQLWLLAFQVGLSQLQVLRLLFPGRTGTKKEFSWDVGLTATYLPAGLVRANPK